MIALASGDQWIVVIGFLIFAAIGFVICWRAGSL